MHKHSSVRVILMERQKRRREGETKEVVGKCNSGTRASKRVIYVSTYVYTGEYSNRWVQPPPKNVSMYVPKHMSILLYTTTIT